jgi:hypothetical protein
VTGIATTKQAQPRDGDGQPPYAPAHLLRMQEAFVEAMRAAHPDRETATASSLVSVLSGDRCIGFLISRGRDGFEAFNADERSLGIFPTQHAAAAAIAKVMRA